ncbi:MAG: T9SS type A sorting domain-containing protein [Taibaiella sp.]|nr:T9SS type A sorting domain-containing protein [Taibaiella sp.]
MNTKRITKRSFGKQWRYLLLLLVCITSVHTKSFARKTYIDTPTNKTLFDFALTAESTTNPALGGKIFDDSSNGGWFCYKRFLMSDYTNDTIVFRFSYSSTYGVPTPAYHKILIVRNGALYDSILNQQDSVDLKIAFPLRGVYTLYYIYPTGHIDLHGDVTIAPKITKFWIEANPICSNFSDTAYNFKIKTEPPIDSLMSFDALAVVDTPSCTNERSALNMKLDITGPVLPLQIYDRSGSTLYFKNFVGAQHNFFSAWNWGGTPNLTDYYVKLHDSVAASLKDCYDLAAFLPGGFAYGYGIQPVISATFTDNLGATWTCNAPIIINSNDFSHYDSVHNVPDMEFDLYDYTVTGNETWTPTHNPATVLFGVGSRKDTIRIEHSINIPQGDLLYLQGVTVEMGPDALINVNHSTSPSTLGGAFIVDNSTVTAYRGCDGTSGLMWGGIQVLGNPHYSQMPIPGVGFSGAQGFCNIKNNSTISFAHNAVTLGTQADYNSFNSEGGVLLATGANFLNNSRSIGFPLYYNHAIGSSAILPNRSSIVNCNFTTTQQLLPYKLFSFIYGEFNSGIQIAGCTFDDQATEPAIGYGVFGIDFSVAISNSTTRPSYFHHLKAGVRESCIRGTETMDVLRSKFSENYVGTYMEANSYARVMSDTFGVPYSPYSTSAVSPYNIGALFLTSSGYTTGNNTFLANPSFISHNIGLVTWNSGSSDNYVMGNTYNYLGAGNVGNYINRSPAGASSITGVLFKCNTHTGSPYDIVARGSNSTTDGIKGTQGASGDATLNSLTISPAYANLYNPGSEVAPITYYYTGATPSYSGTVTIIPTTYTACPDLSSYAGPIGDITHATGTGSSTLRPQALVMHYMTDTTGITHRDSLYYWAGQIGTPTSMLLIANLLVQDSLIDSANHVYNSITANTGITSTEATEYTKWGRKLMNLLIAVRQNDNNIKHLTSAQIDTLHQVADSGKMWAHVRAENWLSHMLYADTMPYTDSVLYPNTGSRPSAPGIAQPLVVNHVYPNPVHELLVVDYTTVGKEGAEIVITNIAGKTIYNGQLKDSGRNEIDTHRLMPGVYLYRIIENGKAMMDGKITKD